MINFDCKLKSQNFHLNLKNCKTTTETLKCQLNETTAKNRSLNDMLINSDLIVENLKRQLQESKSSSDLITNGLQNQIESLKIDKKNYQIQIVICKIKFLT